MSIACISDSTLSHITQDSWPQVKTGKKNDLKRTALGCLKAPILWIQTSKAHTKLHLLTFPCINLRVPPSVSRVYHPKILELLHLLQQARNQLGAPGGAKWFPRGAEIFWTMSNIFKLCPTHFSRGAKIFLGGIRPPPGYGPLLQYIAAYMQRVIPWVSGEA